MSAGPETSDRGPVMITGAAGFVGRHVIAALLAAGREPGDIVGVARREDRRQGSAVRFIDADIEDGAAMRAAISRERPSAIIHLAAIAAPSAARADAARAWRVNFTAVSELADIILAVAPAARLVFAGSSESYGESFRLIHGALDESAPLRPATVYAATKAAADIMLGQRTFDGLDCIRFRAFNHTGAGQDDAFVAPAFARQIARIEKGLQEPVMNVGNLDAMRDFLDVRDVARAYVMALDAPSSVGDKTAINICSGSATRIGDLLERLLAQATVKIAVSVDQRLLRASDTPVAVGDNTRAAERLGWSPQHTIDEALADVLDDWRRRV